MNEPPVPRWKLLGATLLLFAVWSNTFLAFEILLAPRDRAAPLDWWGLTVARNVPVGIVCSIWCFGLRRRESVAIVRAHWRRLLACGALAVPAYNAFMYHGMQQRVAGPIASLLTSLGPLYLLLLGAAFLGERLTRRKLLGLGLGLSGVALIASARGGGSSHWLHVAEIAMAPLVWSVYSVLTRPVARVVSPLLWTLLVCVAGTALFLPFVPVLGTPDVLRLGTREIALVFYLSFAATIGGNALWSWLLRHLPASTTGLTIFLNPPLTLVSKVVWAALFPAAFVVAITAREWVGGAVMLAGVACAVLPARRREETSRS